MKEELKICGLPAVRARWKRQPSSLVRLFFDAAIAKRVGSMCRELAAARKPYRCVETSELEKVAGSVHHGGIVAVVLEEELRSPKQEDLAAWAQARQSVLILDRIGNAHNLGALARSAAFFSVPHLVLVEAAGAARPSEAAFRVAEGGMEHLCLWQLANLPGFLRDLAALGYCVVAATTRGGESLGRAHSRARTGPVALVLGNEEEGLAPEVEAACRLRYTLQGSGAVESLNVSVAGALLIWELLRK